VRRNTAGLIAVLVTGALLAAGPVLAQSTSTTPASSTSGSSTSSTTCYGCTQTVTTSTPTTSVPNNTTTSVAPTSGVSATPVSSPPSTLAFTGANAMWIILLGVALAAIAATLLFVDRRSRKNR
jgi:LPXTG-motif cell wall-anchored protein